MDFGISGFFRYLAQNTRKVALVLGILVFLVYGVTLKYPFYFDDSHTIQSNSLIQTPANLLRLWTSASYYSSLPENWGYRPLTTFSNSVAWIVGKGKSWPFHLQKIILHASVCFLLYLIWSSLWKIPGFYPGQPPELRLKGNSRWRIDPPIAALLLSVVFAIHPANTQVVNYISATSTLLAGFWFLLAYYLYLRFRTEPKWGLLAGSLVSYGCSVLAKEEGITLLGIVVLSELLLPAEKSNRKRRITVGCYFLAAALFAGLLRLMFAETSNQARGTLSAWSYFMTQWRAWLHYMSSLVWPFDLNADNLEFGFSLKFWDYKVIGALCGNLVILIFAWVQRKRWPVFLFSILWFYIAISPASSFVPLAEPVNDHRMYLAYFGLIGAVFPWVLKGIELLFPPVSGALFAAALAGMLIGTEVRNQVWSNNESLWSDTVAKNPTSGRAKNNLALVYMGTSEWDKATQLLEACEKVAPYYTICMINKAIVQAAIGKDAEAEQGFRRVIQMEPRRPIARSYYGDFLLRRGRLEDAIKEFRAVDDITGGMDLQAKVSWIKAAVSLGRPKEAKSVLDDSMKRFPGHPRLQKLLIEVRLK